MLRAANGASVLHISSAYLELVVASAAAATGAFSSGLSASAFPFSVASACEARSGQPETSKAQTDTEFSSCWTGGASPARVTLERLMGEAEDGGCGGDDDDARFPPPFPLPLPSAELRGVSTMAVAGDEGRSFSFRKGNGMENRTIGGFLLFLFTRENKW